MIIWKKDIPHFSLFFFSIIIRYFFGKCKINAISGRYFVIYAPKNRSMRRNIVDITKIIWEIQPFRKTLCSIIFPALHCGDGLGLAMIKRVVLKYNGKTALAGRKGWKIQAPVFRRPVRRVPIFFNQVCKDMGMKDENDDYWTVDTNQ